MLDHESTQVLFFRSSRLQELIIFIQYKRRQNKFVKKNMKKKIRKGKSPKVAKLYKTGD